MKREFLMLAQKYDEQKHSPAGMFLSEKLDGQRCFWDGGLTRGMLKSEVPWANTTKDERYVHKEVATGLWSRYGNVIHAPDWFINVLPRIFLDGELWIQRKDFQTLSSAVKKLVPCNEEWRNVKYMVIDSPPMEVIFSDGVINTTNYKKIFKGIVSWVYEHNSGIGIEWAEKRWYFTKTLLWLHDMNIENDVLKIVPQLQLVSNTAKAQIMVNQMLNSITAMDGEGIILRRAMSFWLPERNSNLLKVKPFKDDEAVICGYTTGKETDKGSKLLGKIGALIVNYRGKIFELSGLTDMEREFSNSEAEQWAISNPGVETPSWIEGKYLKRGTIVTFKYRELTDTGIPKEARYWRIR